MKIAIVTGEVPSAKAGGIGTVAHFLAMGLKARDVAADFFCTEGYRSTGFDAIYLKQFGPHPIHDLSFGRSFRELGDALAGYDVVDFHLPNARGPLLYHQLDPKRCIATLHTTSLGYKRRVYDRLPYKHLAKNERRQKAGFINIAIALERRALKRAGVVNCVAGNLVEESRDWYGCPNVVQTAKAVLIEDRGIEPSKPAPDAPFLFVGRLVAQKGLFDLLEAYRQGRITRPLHIIGDGVLRAQLEAEVARDKLPVTFLGYQDRAGVDAAMASAFALVVPSYYETQPMVAFEGAAWALPVISYEPAAVGDAVASSNAPFAMAPDPAALGHAMAELSADPDRAWAIGSDNLAHHRAGGRYERMIDDYINLYNSVAANS